MVNRPVRTRSVRGSGTATLTAELGPPISNGRSIRIHSITTSAWKLGTGCTHALIQLFLGPSGLGSNLTTLWSHNVIAKIADEAFTAHFPFPEGMVFSYDAAASPNNVSIGVRVTLRTNTDTDIAMGTQTNGFGLDISYSFE